MLTVNEARDLLPEVGDIRWEAPSVMKGDAKIPPKRCRVVEVNRTHLWYTVEFENGFRECYKVPAVKPDPQGGARV
jgi:hypothetical protein